MEEREFVEKEVCNKQHEGLVRLCDERHTRIENNFAILFKKLDIQSIFLVVMSIIGIVIPIVSYFVNK